MPDCLAVLVPHRQGARFVRQGLSGFWQARGWPGYGHLRHRCQGLWTAPEGRLLLWKYQYPMYGKYWRRRAAGAGIADYLCSASRQRRHDNAAAGRRLFPPAGCAG